MAYRVNINGYEIQVDTAEELRLLVSEPVTKALTKETRPNSTTQPKPTSTRPVSATVELGRRAVTVLTFLKDNSGFVTSADLIELLNLPFARSVGGVFSSLPKIVNTAGFETGDVFVVNGDPGQRYLEAGPKLDEAISALEKRFPRQESIE